MNAPRRGRQGVAGHGWPGLKNKETLPAKMGLFQDRLVKSYHKRLILVLFEIYVLVLPDSH